MLQELEGKQFFSTLDAITEFGAIILILILKMRRQRRMTSWTVMFTFADTPHLKHLTDSHQKLNRIFHKQFPDYNNDPKLSGRYYNSNRTLHNRLREVFLELNDICEDMDDVIVFPLFYTALCNTDLLTLQSLPPHQDFSDIVSLYPNWHHDGLSPNSCSFLVFKFTIMLLITFIKHIRQTSRHKSPLQKSS